ncbi:MAG: TauD/TfdA family dioxygenase [Burkholderiales bacterium]|nr:TauD/TfdA family dioxygenase [Burkholderiales bacterium]
MSAVVSETLCVVPLNAPIGAEIRGIDLSQDMDPELMRQIEAAYDRYSVLVFRNQRLTPEQQIRFSGFFGALEIHVLKPYLLQGHPEILVVSNIRDDEGHFIGLPDAGQTWHTDTSYRVKPSRGSVLYALEIPRAPDGRSLGDTLFAGTAPAYDDLLPETKLLLDGKKAVHSYGQRKRIPGSQRAKLTREQLDQTPDAAHPVVRTHPNTGRKALYVFEGECIGIEGLPENRALDLIAELTEHCIQPKYIYRHVWHEGDVVMWDNAATLHLATPDYELPQRRLLYRTTIEGGVPR